MSEKQIIKISVRNLVEFILRSGDLDNRRTSSADRDAMQKGSRLHRKIQKQMGASYRAEVPLSITMEYEHFNIVVEGRADGIEEESGLFVIDEIKGIYMDLERLEEPMGVHLAQAKCYAYIYACEKKLEKMGIQMTYANLETEVIRRFKETYSFEQLESWFTDLVNQYYRWADFQYHWRLQRNASMEKLEFPFEYRDGQREIVRSVYITLKEKKNLFVQAPTGVGKTMSTVFPSVRAVGQGMGEKLFYLTAKTITRTVAEEAFSILRSRGLRWKNITLTAKEKMCICQEPECNPEKCPRAKGHFDRINDAVFALLTEKESFDRDTLLAHAEKWDVCPFEMSLDLSTWVDGVICDYNYVYDPRVRLQRFFGEGVKGEYIFLVDEAHNLVERGRAMYSASIYKEHVLSAKRLLKPYSKKLERYLEKVNKNMLSYKRECENYQILSSVGDIAIGLMSVMSELENFMDMKRKGLIQMPETEEKELLEFYFEVNTFLAIYELVDKNYVIYSELDEENHFKIQLFCVNPAQNLTDCTGKGIGTVFFSATLLPIQYYKSLLTVREDIYAIYAQSPFDEKKKGLYIGQDVSSKYTRRGYEEYRRIAAYIAALPRRKKGNYMVFFPSYKLMQDVFQIYKNKYDVPGVDWVIQTPSMREEDRELFLENFEEDNPHSLLGFCVMGGIFSEGIDLIGNKLIGAIVVGTGIPQVSNEREILKQYYDQNGKNGFDYAYRFPGMNKVLQSAGRVIRTTEDEGIILLLDERFLSREYLALFPREWSSYQTTALPLIEGQIQNFWTERTRDTSLPEKE